MKDKDLLQRFIFESAPVRGEIVHLNHSYQEIMSQHDYPPLIRVLLGEALAVVTLLSALIKGDGRLTLQFRGTGKLKLLLAQCDHLFNIRGIVQHDGDLSASDLQEAQQQGVLAIMINSETPQSSKYQGIVSWQGESLTQAIEGYFSQSEQLPTRLWLSVTETSVAGLLLQVLPQEKPELFTNQWEHLTILTDTITPKELIELNNEDVLHRLYSEEQVRLFDGAPVHFKCTCSVERCENAILILGQEEAAQELEQKQIITVTCEFCNKAYDFDRVDVAAIFKNGGHSQSSSQMH